MNCNSRGEFYAFLRMDYDDNKKDSFIYKYLKEKKDKKANQLFSLYSENKELLCIDFDEREDNLKDIINKKATKLYQVDGTGTKVNKYDYDYYAILSCCYKAFKEENWLERDDIIKIMYNMQNQKRHGIRREKRLFENKPELDDVALQEIADSLLEQCIHLSVKDFFYDGKKDRRTDGVLDMYFQYTSGRGDKTSTQTVVSVIDNLEYQKEIEIFYEYYQQEKKKRNHNEFFLPLAIDPTSGAGLYILDDAYLYDEDNETKMSGKGNYCVLTFDHMAYSWYEEDEERFSTTLGYQIKYREEKLSEAINLYKIIINQKNALKGYGDINGKYPKDDKAMSKIGSKSNLRKYFEDMRELETDSVQTTKQVSNLNKGLLLFAKNAQNQIRKS